MEYEEIIEAIGREAADLPPDVAERAAQAVLQTLAERLPRGEARHILAELPAELKPWVYTEADAEGFGWWTWYSSMSGRCSRRWPRRSTPRSGST